MNKSGTNYQAFPLSRLLITNYKLESSPAFISKLTQWEADVRRNLADGMTVYDWTVKFCDLFSACQKQRASYKVFDAETTSGFCNFMQDWKMAVLAQIAAEKKKVASTYSFFKIPATPFRPRLNPAPPMPVAVDLRCNEEMIGQTVGVGDLQLHPQTFGLREALEDQLNLKPSAGEHLELFEEELIAIIAKGAVLNEILSRVRAFCISFSDKGPHDPRRVMTKLVTTWYEHVVESQKPVDSLLKRSRESSDCTSTPASSPKLDAEEGYDIDDHNLDLDHVVKYICTLVE